MENINRNDQIHEKGFDIFDDGAIDYNKLKVGTKTLQEVSLDLGNLQPFQTKYPFCDKKFIMQAMIDNNLPLMREISNFYYRISGIYERVCNYFAYLYRYDWYISEETYDDNASTEKMLKDFARILNYLDNSYIKKICGEMALTVIKEGCYYGYLIPNKDKVIIQQLPSTYCRSKYCVKGMPAVEFNMKYFDTFKDPKYRAKILNMFPEDFKKGYILFKQGKLPVETKYDTNGWYMLDPEYAFKLNYNMSDVPPFINAIPYIIDLDAAQALDRRKQMQKLLKILVQKLPMDKNGDLIFDIDEAKDIHNNAVKMLQDAVGVDVVTTFADIESIDLSDSNTATKADDLEKVERTVYNALGTSQSLFNSDRNLSLEKSILNDESTMRNLLLQLTMLFDKVTQQLNKNKSKYNFKFYMLETTQYNYKEMSKLYKEDTQIGFSKMLPQIALGHSQSFILNTASFENDILHLSEIMIPPLMSSTLSGQDILKDNIGSKSSTSSSTGTGQSEAGRPEKEDSEKSEKTIANRESM